MSRYDLIGGQTINIEKMTKKQIDAAITNIGTQIKDHLLKSDVTVIDLSTWPKVIQEGVLKILVNYKDQIASGKIIIWLE
jgi:hypothetical protein